MPSPLALEVVKSYEDEEMPADSEEGYKADLRSEMGALKAAMDKGDMAGAATAFEEMVKLCKA